MARQWSARCYGVARQREGSRQNSTRVSGVLSLYPLARGCRRIWRGVVLVYWLRRRDALRYGVSFATTRSQQLAEGAALTLFLHPYAREGADGQAVVCPLLRGSSPTRGVAPKQHQGLRRAFPLSLGAWVPKNLARRSFGLLASAPRRSPVRGQ